jgi:alpha-glucosidase
MPRTLIYEIFVDRFAKDGGAAIDPHGSEGQGEDPWKHHAGGTLDGIGQRIEHVQSLGADALYLTPVFTAPTNHKYDTTAFDEIDPHFGGDAAFDRLAAILRARRMGLILDGVFNHVGETHKWFEEARTDPASAKVRYFKFERWPDRYSHWRGYGFLPELDLREKAVREELFTKKRSVLRRWIERGATGWRLDCANDLGFAACRTATRVLRRDRAEDGVIGEVMTYAEDWVRNRRLDGVMNYYFRESIVGLVRGEVTPLQAAYNLEHVARRYPVRALNRSWNILSTHDTPRLRTLIPDRKAERFARTLQFAAPGTPLIYYGEEIGLEGGKDPDNRRPMLWDSARWDNECMEHIRTLAGIRRASPALRIGRYVPFPHPGEPRIIAFARATRRPEDTIIVAANATDAPLWTRVFMPGPSLYDALPLEDLLGAHAPVRVQAGRIDVELAPWQVALFRPNDGTIDGYRFFRSASRQRWRSGGSGASKRSGRRVAG